MSKKIEINDDVLSRTDLDSVSAGLSQETIDEQNAQLEKITLGPFWYRDRQFGNSFQVGTMTERERQEFIYARLQDKNKK